MLPPQPPQRLDRAALRAHLERALACYYHAGELMRSPLSQLVPGDEGVSDLADLRALLREALNSLRPPEQMPVDDPLCLPYRVATLHYFQSLPRGLVCEELSISQATFYRHRNAALDEMADYLWRQQAAKERAAPSPQLSRGDVLNRAVSAVSGSYRELLHLRDVAEGVRDIVTRMPGVQEASLVLDVSSPSEPVYGDPTLLRQVLLNLLTDALQVTPAPSLTLQMGTCAETIRGQLVPYPIAAHHRAGGGVAVAQRLLEAARGRLVIHTHPPSAVFALPCALPPLVVCVDDDRDASRLYGVYLAGKGYRVRGVTTGDELHAVLAGELPGVILLDVLMPREDGWAILDELRRAERTRHIPVVICSVLQQPDLALAMGAAAVLTKPVTPDALLQTLDRVLADPSETEPSS